jgi:hypothetical protein
MIEVKNKSVIIFGTGPSLADYDSSLNEGKILIGSNEIIFYKTIMDYYFIGDGGDNDRGYYSDPESYHRYQAKINKFIRLPSNKNKSPSYRTMPKNLEGFKYYSVDNETLYNNFPFEKNKVNDAGSISFDIFQWCLLNEVKEIFLIGHDCCYNQGSFFSSNIKTGIKNHSKIILNNWSKLENFVNLNYRNTKVINVNPKKMKCFNLIRFNY